MSKYEFLNELAGLLMDIPQEERQEALSYYKEYIEDAGEENEEAVLAELGNPKDVAAAIKADLSGKEASEANSSGEKWVPAYRNQQNNANRNDQQYNAPKSKSNPVIMALLVLALILTSPIWFSALFGIFMALFGITLGFGIGGIALLVVGVVLFFIGIVNLLHAPLAGFALIGAGLLVAALGILFLLLITFICGFVIPAVCKFVSTLFRAITHKTREVHA